MANEAGSGGSSDSGGVVVGGTESFDTPDALAAAITSAGGETAKGPRDRGERAERAERGSEPARGERSGREQHASVAGGDEETGESSTVEDGEQPAQPVAADPSTGDPSTDQRYWLARWNLPAPRTGETYAQVNARLERHDRARWTKHKEENQELRRRVDGLQSLEPLMRQFFEQQVAARDAAAREQALAALPDPEVQTDQYNRVLLEGLARKMAEREEADRQAALDAQQQADQDRAIHERLDVFDNVVTELEHASADPNFQAALGYLTEIGRADVMTVFPDATAAEVDEYVQNAQLIDLGNRMRMGIPPVQAIMQAAQTSYALAQRYFGLTPTQAAQVAAQAATPAPGNGNGVNGKPKTGTPAGGSPTVARLTAEHAQEASRRVVSGPGSRGGAPTGTGTLDLTKLSADEMFRAAMDGNITEDMILAQLGSTARR